MSEPRSSGFRKVLALALAVSIVGLLTPRAFAASRPGSNRIVTYAHDGAEGNGQSNSAVVSADGRIVAFSSQASNLVPDDTNRSEDVFVRDLATETIERVTVASDGTQGNSWTAATIAMSGDGRYVAFLSNSSNLVPDDNNGTFDAFVHDRDTGETIRASVASDGTEADDFSQNLAISGNGRFVVYSSRATNLSEGNSHGQRLIFVHDVIERTTEVVSKATDGTLPADASFGTAISDDGRYVAFESLANNLSPDDANPHRDIFIHDRQNGTTELVSKAYDGGPANLSSFSPAISADGRYVAFASSATNLVPATRDPIFVHVYVHDRESGRNERVSVTSAGAEATGSSTHPKMSPDGRYVLFNGTAPDLAPNDDNAFRDAFLHDRMLGITELVSPNAEGHGANGHASSSSLSDDARFIGVFSHATDMVAADTNGFADGLIRDRGPAPGILDLSAEVVQSELAVAGTATFTGQVLAASEREPQMLGAQAGERLDGARVVFRPYEEDLWLRVDLSSMPRIAGMTGTPGLVYGMTFTAGDDVYEARAARSPDGASGIFTLHRCSAGDCSKVADLDGGYGSRGVGVTVSLPIELIGDAAALSDITAFISLGESAVGRVVTIDELHLGSAIVPQDSLVFGVGLASSHEGDVDFDTEAAVADGRFETRIPIGDLEPGEHLLWARVCSGDLCQAQSWPFQFLTESPTPETTAVSFTERSAISGQFSDKTLFEARLTDSGGDPIQGAGLTFELAGEESTRSFSATTDDDGVASVTPTLEEKPGPYQLTVRYAGDEAHAGDADTVSFVVDKEDTVLELAVHGEDDDKTLRARLSDLDTSSEGIAGRGIDFYSDGELIGSGETDSDGVASVALPPRHRGANRTYEAVFEGDDFYLGSADERTGKGKGGNGGGSGGNGGGREAGRTYAGKMLLI